MTPTAIMTPMAWIARRRVKASMDSFHCSGAAADVAVAWKRKVPEAVTPPGLGVEAC
jgi:hypothetical protein